MAMASTPYKEPEPEYVWTFMGIRFFKDPTLRRGIVECYDKKGKLLGRIVDVETANVGESD